MTTLQQANKKLQKNNILEAIRLYVEALVSNPALSSVIQPNLKFAQKRLLRMRASLNSRPSVLICGWDLSHNAAGRVATLAKIYESISDVVITGFLYGSKHDELWAPLQNFSISIRPIVIVDNNQFINQVIEFVLSHPCDILHLSKPRFPNIFIGMIYKSIWGTKVLVDVDDEELAFVSATDSISIEDYLQTHSTLPSLNNLGDKEWTQISVGLTNAFDGVTVANLALQKRYGGTVLRHARDENQFKPSAVRRQQARDMLGIPADEKVVIFFGTPRHHKGLKETAEAIASLKRSDVRYLVVGDFPEGLKKLKQEISSIPELKTQFLGDQPFESTPDILSAADVCVLLQDPENIVAQFQTPAKLTDALAMGLTVLAETTPGLVDLEEMGAFQAVNRNNFVEELKKVFEQVSVEKNSHPIFKEILSINAHQSVLKNLIESTEASLLNPRLQKLAEQAIFYPSISPLVGSGNTNNYKHAEQLPNLTKTFAHSVNAEKSIEQIIQLAQKAHSLDDWSGAYEYWRSILEHPLQDLSIELLVQVSQELFALDAFADAATALNKAASLNPDHPSVLCEQAQQYYYHCYSSWLMLVTENEPDWYKADGLETRPDWQTACQHIEKAEKAAPRNNLRRYVQAYLLLAEEAWDKQNRKEAHAALGTTLKAIGPNKLDKALTQAIYTAIDQFRDGQVNEKDPYFQTLQDQIKALPLDLLSVPDWLCLNDILNWNGLLLCGFVAREKAVDLALVQGKAKGASKVTLKTALKAALDRNDTTLADDFLGKLKQIGADAIDVRELDSCCELMKGNLDAFRQKWPHPPTPAEESLREYLKGKTVAVVGPAPTGTLDGEEIDRHDVVVRINWRGQKTMPDAIEFGSRTDLSLYNAHTARLFKRSNKKPPLQGLSFVLFRRAQYDYAAQSEINKRLIFGIEYPACFYKSLNAIQHAQFTLALNGAKKLNVFKVNFYTTVNHHAKGYRGTDAAQTKGNILQSLRPVLVNHDIISQYLVFRNILNCFDVFSRFAPAITDILKRVSDICPHPDLMQSDVFLGKPKRNFISHPVVKSHSVGKHHFWYDNYATRDYSCAKNYSHYDKLNNKKILFIAHNFTLSTGVSRPISHILNAVLADDIGSQLESIEFKDGVDVSQYLSECKKYDLLIVNSIGAFVKNPSLLKLLKHVDPSKIAVYLHETKWVIEKLKSTNEELYFDLMDFLRCTLVLCVSEGQQAYFARELAITRSSVVYNTTTLPFDPWQFQFIQRSKDQPLTILMAGTLQARKGVDLFSRVADLAKAKGRNYKFLWAGGETKEIVYKSDNVLWLGNKSSEDLQRCIAAADLFFLSSEDDPFPLSVIEALQMRRRVVAYKYTGAAEILSSSQSNIGEIFENYEPTAALDAIDSALASTVSFCSFDNVIYKFSLVAFTDRFFNAIAETDRTPRGSGVIEKKEKVLLLCNGPSFAEADFSEFKIENCLVARMNHFYLEKTPFANGRVDFLFWGVNEPVLHDNIAEQIKAKRYNISNFYCPVPYEELKFANRSNKSIIDRRIYYDAWLKIAENPRLARAFMSRPLPTSGLQALACLLVMGYREYIVAGMDFYAESTKRYHYDVPDSITSKMDSKHFQPGYEKGAHSMSKDVAFLHILLDEFKDIKLNIASKMPVLVSTLKSHHQSLNNAIRSTS